MPNKLPLKLKRNKKSLVNLTAGERKAVEVAAARVGKDVAVFIRCAALKAAGWKIGDGS